MSLLSIIAQAAAPGFVQQDALSPVDVVASRPQVNTQGAFPKIDMGNVRYGNSAREANEMSEKAAEHKGKLFGAKGTLRDVIGLIGDSFLTQAGRPQQYSAQRQKERQSDAMQGFTENPVAAIERLVQAGFNDEATTLFDKNQDNETKQAQLANQTATLENNVANQKIAHQDKARTKIAQALTAANPQTYPMLKKIVTKMIEDNDLPAEEFPLPDVYDESVKGLGLAGTPTTTQINTNQREQDRDIKIQQGVTRDETTKRGQDLRARSSAASTAARAGPQPTTASVTAPILKKVANGKELTKGEADALARAGLTPEGRAGGKAKRAPPPLPPGFAVTPVKK